MREIVIGIRVKLNKDGAKDIDLLVHSYYLGRPSPCVVIEDWINRGLVGGHIQSLDEILQLEVAKHPGYIVKERMALIATTNGESQA